MEFQQFWALDGIMVISGFTDFQIKGGKNQDAPKMEVSWNGGSPKSMGFNTKMVQFGMITGDIWLRKPSWLDLAMVFMVSSMNPLWAYLPIYLHPKIETYTDTQMSRFPTSWGTPSYHSFYFCFFCEINYPASGAPPYFTKPPCVSGDIPWHHHEFHPFLSPFIQINVYS